MLKRNLIAIAVIGLAAVFTASAFGQPNRKAKTKNPATSFRPNPTGDGTVEQFKGKQKISHADSSQKSKIKQSAEVSNMAQMNMQFLKGQKSRSTRRSIYTANPGMGVKGKKPAGWSLGASNPTSAGRRKSLARKGRNP